MKNRYLIVVLAILIVVFLGYGVFKRFSDNQQEAARYQSLNKRIPINTKYILLEDNHCPDGYYEVQTAGDRLDFIIPAGTLVIVNGISGSKKYHLYAKKGETQPLLPPVRE